jgi:hypothetical protein
MREEWPFRFGVIGEAITSRAALLAKAHRAEALGYSTLLLRDHLVPEPFGEQLADALSLPVEPGRTLAALHVGRVGLGPEELAELEPVAAVPVGLALGEVA